MWLQFSVASLLKRWPKLLRFSIDIDLRLNPDSFQVHKQTPSSSTCQCYVVQWTMLVMGTLRQPSLDGGPLLKHTSVPNLLYLYVYLYVSFNHSLPLASAWPFG